MEMRNYIDTPRFVCANSTEKKLTRLKMSKGKTTTPSPYQASVMKKNQSKKSRGSEDEACCAKMAPPVTSVEWLRRPSSLDAETMKKFHASREAAAAQEPTADAPKADSTRDSDVGESLDDEVGELTLGAEEAESISEECEDEECRSKKSKSRGRRIGPLEYDLEDMYPEIGLLIRSRKKDWDFSDPDIIRALWLESRTNLLSDWRVGAAKINFKKNPAIEVRSTFAISLRNEYRIRKENQQRKEEEKEFSLINLGKENPVFGPVQIVSNLTTDMRFKYIRNNPPVPARYVEHFGKYRKPPFTLNAAPCGKRA